MGSGSSTKKGKQEEGMFAKLKKKGLDKKAEYDKQQQAQWLAKVTTEEGKGDDFVDFAGWKDAFEPSKDKKDKKDKDDSGPNALERKAMQKMAENIKGNIMKTLTETVSKLLGPSEAAVKGAEPALAKFLNSANAVTLTYRFEHKSKKKTAYLRLVGAERLAINMVAAIDAENAKLGGDAAAAELDEAKIKEIVDSLVAKVKAVIDEKQAEAIDAVKNSPLFQQAPDGAEQQMDEGVLALQGFLRTTMESKIEVIVSTITPIVEGLLKVAAAHRAAIKAAAANEASKVGEPEGDMLKARDAVLAKIEESYKQLDDAVLAYVTDLVSLLTAANSEGGSEDEE